MAVCVPVHGQPEGLAVLLDALGRPGVLAGEPTLIVLAIDGPDADLEALGRRAGAEVVVSAVNRGSYAARNMAIDALPASVQHVLFTDSDCSPRPGWARAHLEALAESELSGGRIDLRQPSPPTPASFLDARWHLHQDRYVAESAFAATANLAVRRSVLDDHRFDPRLRSGGDREFCRRAVAAGASIVYTPDSVVDHPARRTADELRAKVDRIAAAIPDNPDRPSLPGRSPLRSARLVLAARRAGAVRTPGDLIELIGLEHHRHRRIRAAILTR